MVMGMNEAKTKFLKTIFFWKTDPRNFKFFRSFLTKESHSHHLKVSDWWIMLLAPLLSDETIPTSMMCLPPITSSNKPRRMARES